MEPHVSLEVVANKLTTLILQIQRRGRMPRLSGGGTLAEALSDSEKAERETVDHACAWWAATGRIPAVSPSVLWWMMWRAMYAARAGALLGMLKAGHLGIPLLEIHSSGSEADLLTGLLNSGWLLAFREQWESTLRARDARSLQSRLADLERELRHWRHLGEN